MTIQNIARNTCKNDQENNEKIEKSEKSGMLLEIREEVTAFINNKIFNNL